MSHDKQYGVRHLVRWSHVGPSLIQRGIAILSLMIMLGAGFASVCSAAPAVNATLDAALMCTGDCDNNGVVTIAELVKGVRIFRGEDPIDQCPTFDCDGT